MEQKSGYRYRSLQTGSREISEKRITEYRRRKDKKGNNVIFDDLSLELFQGEITGIVFDDILEQKLFIDMLLGDILLYSGKIFVNEERKAYEEAARLLKQQVAVIGSKSKLLPSITIEDNIFLFQTENCFWIRKSIENVSRS